MIYKLKLWYCKLFKKTLVALFDFDGEVSIRIAYRRPWSDHLLADRMTYSIRTVFLLPDGKVGKGSYCERWIQIYPTPQQKKNNVVKFKAVK